MVKKTRVASVTVLAGLALGMSTLAASPAGARSVSDEAAAILYYSKVVYSSADGVDTLIRLSNTDPVGVKQAHCYYIDANSHCSNNPAQICEPLSNGCGAGACVGGCMEIDFDVMLTHEQPLAWHAGSGLSRNDVPLRGGVGVCGPGFLEGSFCTSTAQCNCQFGQTNAGTGVPPVPEDPFIGSLVCIQYVPASGGTPAHPDNNAGTRNSLIGQATIETLGPLDVAAYNASGLRFKAPEAGIPGDELHLDGVQYDSCPTSLILDFLFDDGPVFGGSNSTELTLIPCGNDFGAQIFGSATAQFLVFNEFEQRFSTTRAVSCSFNSLVSNIDTTNALRSIFSWQVAGTAAGQARIRGVGNASTGRGLLGMAVLHAPPGSAAFNLHENGSPVFGVGRQPDIITNP